MDERKLRDFFSGKRSARSLAKSIGGSVAHPDSTTWIVYVREMKGRFAVSRAMAISLCDAVTNNELPAGHLAWIGFMLIASDRFEWEEDDLLTQVFECWASPQINWPLTIENVCRFKRWLTGEEPPPQESVRHNPSAQKLVSLTRKENALFPKLKARLCLLSGGKVEG